MIGSAAAQMDDAGMLAVDQAVAAHCAKMADVARNRIGIGSVTPSKISDPNKIVDHANGVRSDHFILTAPTGMEGAMAALLGLQDHFHHRHSRQWLHRRRRRAAISTRSSKS